MLYPGDTQIEIINTGGAHTAGVSHCLGHSGAVYLKEPLVAATNIFELSDTPSQGENDPQTAVDFLQGAFGMNRTSEGNSVVSASSDEAYRATYVELNHEAIQAMVATLATAH